MLQQHLGHRCRRHCCRHPLVLADLIAHRRRRRRRPMPSRRHRHRHQRRCWWHCCRCRCRAYAVTQTAAAPASPATFHRESLRYKAPDPAPYMSFDLSHPSLPSNHHRHLLTNQASGDRLYHLAIAAAHRPRAHRCSSRRRRWRRPRPYPLGREQAKRIRPLLLPPLHHNWRRLQTSRCHPSGLCCPYSCLCLCPCLCLVSGQLTAAAALIAHHHHRPHAAAAAAAFFPTEAHL
jgi:hypothetical protein